MKYNIRKYNNRKYYNVNESRYNTISEIAQLVRDKHSITVLHKQDDITNKTLKKCLEHCDISCLDLIELITKY